MNPDWPAAPEDIGLHLADLGRLDEALAWANKTRGLSADSSDLRGAIGAYGALGEMERAVKLAREAPRDSVFWIIRQAQARRFTGDLAGALALVEDAIKGSEYAPPAYFYVAADLSLLAGKFAESRAHLERLCPPLPEPVPRFDDFGFCNAPGYAYVLQRLGDRERAEQVLHAYLRYIQSRTRLGIKGYGIADVESLALLGGKDEALAHLREAVDAGWRSTWPRHGWSLSEDPYLVGLRDDARFRAIVAETDADLARMRERAAQAETSGDWQPLLALAAQGEGRVAPTAGAVALAAP